MANITENAAFRSTVSEGADIFIGLYMTTVCLMSIVLNIIVLWGTVKKDQELTDIDIITFNISLCQLVPALLCYPLVVVSAFSHGWYFSQLVCDGYGFFVYFFAMCTIGLLLLLTLYRHMRMFHQHLFIKQNASRVRWMVCVGLGASYLYGLLWALPPVLGYGSFILQSHNLACSVDWTTLPLPYTLGGLLLGYLLPVSTMVGVYGRILVTLRSSSQKIRKRSDSRFKKVCQVTIVSFLHCACFLLMWTPYALLSFLTIFSLPASNIYEIMAPFVAKFGTLINPFVFFVIDKKAVKSTTMVKKDDAKDHMLENTAGNTEPGTKAGQSCRIILHSQCSTDIIANTMSDNCDIYASSEGLK